MSTREMLVQGGRFYRMLPQAVFLLLMLNFVQGIDYDSFRKDKEPKMIMRRNNRPLRRILENELSGASGYRKTYTVQEGTEVLLHFGSLLRHQILDIFGSLIFEHYEDFNLNQVEALFRVYDETMKRKYNIFEIVPSVLQHRDLRPSSVCRYIHLNVRTCLKETAKNCMTLRTNDQVKLRQQFIAALNYTDYVYKEGRLSELYPDVFFMDITIRYLQQGILTLNDRLVAGFLNNIQYDEYDERVREAEKQTLRHLLSSRNGARKDNTRRSLSVFQINQFYTIAPLVRYYLQENWHTFPEPIAHQAHFLAGHLIKHVGSINPNIELLGTVYEGSVLHLKYLFDLIIPSDTVDPDVASAKDYLLRKVTALKIVDRFLRIEKYQQSGPEQLFMETMQQLKEVGFARDIASALYAHAQFWHRSVVVENLNDLLLLFNAYENLRTVEEHKRFITIIDRIREHLWNAKNVTIDIICNNPRACLRLGLELVLKCDLVSAEIKNWILLYFDFVNDRGSPMAIVCNGLGEKTPSTGSTSLATTRSTTSMETLATANVTKRMTRLNMITTEGVETIPNAETTTTTAVAFTTKTEQDGQATVVTTVTEEMPTTVATVATVATTTEATLATTTSKSSVVAALNSTATELPITTTITTTSTPTTNELPITTTITTTSTPTATELPITTTTTTTSTSTRNELPITITTTTPESSVVVTTQTPIVTKLPITQSKTTAEPTATETTTSPALTTDNQHTTTVHTAHHNITQQTTVGTITSNEARTFTELTTETTETTSSINCTTTAQANPTINLTTVSITASTTAPSIALIKNTSEPIYLETTTLKQKTSETMEKLNEMHLEEIIAYTEQSIRENATSSSTEEVISCESDECSTESIVVTTVTSRPTEITNDTLETFEVVKIDRSVPIAITPPNSSVETITNTKKTSCEDSGNCSDECSDENCSGSCTGPNCTDRCIGPNCSKECSGDDCSTRESKNCVGPQCQPPEVECSGEDCDAGSSSSSSSKECPEGKNCENDNSSSCSGDHCSGSQSLECINDDCKNSSVGNQSNPNPNGSRKTEVVVLCHNRNPHHQRKKERMQKMQEETISQKSVLPSNSLAAVNVTDNDDKDQRIVKPLPEPVYFPPVFDPWRTSRIHHGRPLYSAYPPIGRPQSFYSDIIRNTNKNRNRNTNINQNWNYVQVRRQQAHDTPEIQEQNESLLRVPRDYDSYPDM